MPFFTVLLFLVAFQSISDGAPGPKYPVPRLPNDAAWDEVLVEKRAECTAEQQDQRSDCPVLESQGYCDSSSIYYQFMQANCFATCGGCEMPPTEPPAVDHDACLQAHNAKRALHGASPLVWNDTLTQHAQTWADHLLSLDSLVHANGIGEGENLAWGKGPTFRTCVNAMNGWYDDEEPKYDYDNPGFYSATGHFTQIVWKGTTDLGVALAQQRGDDGYVTTYIVPRFYPSGNVLGQFAENVEDKAAS